MNELFFAAHDKKKPVEDDEEDPDIEDPAVPAEPEVPEPEVPEPPPAPQPEEVKQIPITGHVVEPAPAPAADDVLFPDARAEDEKQKVV